MTSENQNRQIIVISGQYPECLRYAKKLTNKLDALFLEDQKKAHTFLGQEFDAVIFDTHESFDPNAFGAITGTIRGNGFLLLLKPNEIFRDSLFLDRFWSVVNRTEHQYIDVSTVNEYVIEALEKPQSTSYQTNDQNNAIESIIHVVKGHRRRPLVITADRGRGKSAALGIAAAKLFEAGYKHIVVCAPSKKTAKIIFKHALANQPECHLAFFSPDELQKTKPKADLVLIDEAAAIPVPLLSNFLKHYSRIVFSTTQHGYEGSGRGFSVNFKKILDNVAPEWVNCELKTPIRWGENDTLENFIFKALLLNAEPTNFNSKVTTFDADRCKTTTLEKEKLIKNDEWLSELFGLLVSAHYQTKPSDLMHLLDDKLVSIHVTQFESKIIAVALLIKEGNLSPELVTDIYVGTRRIQGHLVAQSLSANVGIENAPILSGERIIRIAVHPELQQQGFGTALVKLLVKQSDADYLSTSFAASTALLKFWDQLQFMPVYLGMKRDASSGTHSVIMLIDKNKKGSTLKEKAQQRFAIQFPYSLSEQFKELESELVLELLAQQIRPSKSCKPSMKLNELDEKELRAFATKQRGYENSLFVIWNLVCSKLSSNSVLTVSEKKILVLKVLQKRSWQSLTEKMSDEIKGKKDALKLIRKAIEKLLLHG